MKWFVHKWDHLDGGSPRKVFEGTEKKARSYYSTARKKMSKTKQAGGLLLLKTNPTYMLIVSQFSNIRKEGIFPNGNGLI